MVNECKTILSTTFRGLNTGFLIPEFILGVVVYLCFKLINWGISFAATAVVQHLDLMATAAVITAVAGIPVALLTMILNKYQDIRNGNLNPPS